MAESEEGRTAMPVQDDTTALHGPQVGPRIWSVWHFQTTTDGWTLDDDELPHL